MEYLVAGASAIQVGTTNYYNPRAAFEIVEELPAHVHSLGAAYVREIVGTLQDPLAAQMG